MKKQEYIAFLKRQIENNETTRHNEKHNPHPLEANVAGRREDRGTRSHQSQSPERRGRTDAQNAKYEFEIGHFKTKDEEHETKVRTQSNYRNNLDRQLKINSELDQRGDTFYEKGQFQIGSDEKKVFEDKKRLSHDFFLKNGEDIRIREISKINEVRAISPVKGAGILTIGEDAEVSRMRLADSKKSYMRQLNTDTGGLKAFTKKKAPFENYIDPNSTTGLMVGLHPEEDTVRRIKAKEYKDALTRQKELETELRTARANANKREVVDPDVPLPYMRY